jgi:hypothetical protein
VVAAAPVGRAFPGARIIFLPVWRWLATHMSRVAVPNPVGRAEHIGGAFRNYRAIELKGSRCSRLGYLLGSVVNNFQ